MTQRKNKKEKLTIKAQVAIDEQGNWAIGGLYNHENNLAQLDEWCFTDDFYGNVKTFQMELDVVIPEKIDKICKTCGIKRDDHSDEYKLVSTNDEIFKIDGEF